MDNQTDTEELNAEVQETFLYHNRIFQRYAVDNNIYSAPVDEDEGIRLRIQHEALLLVFDRRLIFPSIGSLRRILDCGFGTGAWAFQVAWDNPRCEVRGIDVTPHHHNPEESVENLYLDIDDLNMPRLVAGGINGNRWNGYLRDMLRCLRGGGWCQLVEIDYNAQSDNGRLAENQRDYDIGVANQENVRMLLSSLALYPLTNTLGMSITEFHVLVAQARAEASNPALKPYFPLYVCVGRKPRR
ncbi:S-adenosyl-L-methionine-dependent methyltransferase [Xylariaceae sp. FL0804]|nr:S-adenosyl-L-methionine-dependent methyltransferase [Xylariaceae sp. FL0804]